MKAEEIIKKIDPNKEDRMSSHDNQASKDLDNLVTKSLEEQIGLAAAIKFLGDQIDETKSVGQILELVIIAVTEILEERHITTREELQKRIETLAYQNDQPTESDTQPQPASQPAIEVPLSQDETSECSQSTEQSPQ